jgi:hypothetical protein
MAGSDSCGARLLEVIVMVAAFVVAAGGQTRAGVVPGENRLPAEFLVEADAIEKAFEMAFDDLEYSNAWELARRLSDALRPSGDFAGDYEIVFCEVGTREADGALEVDFRVKYLLLDDGYSLERELERTVTVGGPE